MTNKADIAEAPLLDGYVWIADEAMEHVLVVGTVTGHPKIEDWRKVVTSEVVEVDRAHGDVPEWVQTRNTLYRLGLPAGLRSH